LAGLERGKTVGLTSRWRSWSIYCYIIASSYTAPNHLPLHIYVETNWQPGWLCLRSRIRKVTSYWEQGWPHWSCIIQTRCHG